MYYKKVWIIILIIVIMGGLFPSVLIANADEGEGGEGGVPDLEYSLENCPFPGKNDKLTENTWNAFLQRAEELGHSEIRKVEYSEIYFSDGYIYKSKPGYGGDTLFYSTDGQDVEIVSYITEAGWYKVELIHKDSDKINFIGRNGHKTGPFPGNSRGCIYEFAVHPEYRDDATITASYVFTSHWYSADVSNDPYQELPEKFNIDLEMGYGMYFIKPKEGEIITVPLKGAFIRDFIEIEIIVPQFYFPEDGLMEMLYEIKGEIGKVVKPNFVIRLYSHNVSEIQGSKSPGDSSVWILQHQIEFIEGYYDVMDMYAAKFKARVPIFHKIPEDDGPSLIVADLYVDYSNNEWERQQYRIDDARTWVRYLTIQGIVDEDGDGIDDRTGHPIHGYDPSSPIDEHGLEKPDIEDYDSTILGRLSYYWDSLVYYVKLPFYYVRVGIEGIIEWISNIGTFIDSFTSIFDKLFSFLPSEITAMLALGFSTLMIITIVRAIRGS